ncbi:MAG: tetratricopeptide repeat protein [Acidobacteriota bacterium]
MSKREKKTTVKGFFKRWKGWIYAGLALVVVLLLQYFQPKRPEPPEVVTPAMAPPVQRIIRTTREDLLLDLASPAAWNRYAEVLDAHHFYAEALTCYRWAQRLEPRSFPIAFNIAVVEEILGADAKTVDRLYRKAMTFNDRVPPAHARHGQALVRLGEIEDGVSAFEKSIELEEGFAVGHRLLGSALLSLEQLDRAETHLERAVELDADEGLAWSELSKLRRLQGDMEGAAEALEQAEGKPREAGLPDPVRYQVQRSAMDPDSCRGRGSDMMGLQRYQEALEAFNCYTEVVTDDAWAERQRAICQLQLGRRELALPHLLRSQDLAPDEVATLSLLAGMYEDDNDVASALPLRARITELAPDQAVAWARLARLEGRLGRTSQALAHFEHSITLGEVADPGLEHDWASTLVQAGRAEEAIEHFEKALELDPNSLITNIQLGGALEQVGRVNDAKEVYRRAIELSPGGYAAERLAALGG